MQNADPLMPGATIGQSFTTSTGTFTAVPAELEETTEIQLVAETYSEVNAAFGGSALTDTTVLDQTFDDAYLVGRPLSIGNFVSSSAIGGLVFTTVTNTYTPYLVIGDVALPDSQLPDAITGTPYQEVISNFPLASQILTGLFLNVTLSGPQGPSETDTHTILDRIGFAARQGLTPIPNLTVSPNAPPAVSSFDVTTVDVLAGLQDPNAVVRRSAETGVLQAALAQQGSNAADTPHTMNLAQEFAIDYTSLLATADLSDSDILTAELAPTYNVVAYSDRPRLVVASLQIVQNTASQTATASVAIDLLREQIRVVAAPGQASSSTFDFNVARGEAEDAVEHTVTANSQVPGSGLTAGVIMSAATQQGIALAVLVGDQGIAQLSSFALDAEAVARVTAALEAGQAVVIPTSLVSIDGQETTAWFQTDIQTGYTIGVMQSGSHQGILQYAIVLGFAAEDFVAGVVAAYIDFQTKVLPYKNPGAEKSYLITHWSTIGGILAGSILVGGGLLPTAAYAAAFVGLFFTAYAFALNEFGRLQGIDPPVPPFLSDENFPNPLKTSTQTAQVVEPTTAPAGAVVGQSVAGDVASTGALVASWHATTFEAYEVSTLDAGAATIIDAAGHEVGSGAVALSATSPVPASVAGNDDISVSGTGNLSFYGPASTSLGVSGQWSDYEAAVTGSVDISLTTDALTLNGQTLPAGTYTIATSSATLSGNGVATSPDFAESVSITTTEGTVDLGPGTGNVTGGGGPLDLEDETTLDGYTGTLIVSATGDGTDSVAVDGTSDNVLQVSGSLLTLTTDENAPVTFQADVRTSLADTYDLTAQAPDGWTVSVTTTGQVTATPAPGLQSGTYPIQLIAQSTTDPNLEAQSIVDVTINPTKPGITFSVAQDPEFTVPFNGAQLPTAFLATIHNNGPTADTYTLTLPRCPPGSRSRPARRRSRSRPGPPARSGSTCSRTPGKSPYRARPCRSPRRPPASRTQPSPARRPSSSSCPSWTA